MCVHLCVLPAPAATGKAALPACSAAGGWGVMPRVKGRGYNLTTGTTDKSPMDHYLRNREKQKEAERG